MKRFIKSAIACIAAVAMVITAVPAAVTTQAASKKTVTVKNQQELEAAIKTGATKITIKTSKNVKITIPASKKAAKVDLIVAAKNATITNKAQVKTLTIKDAKAFTESGKNNDIKVMDTKLTLTVEKASKGSDIQVAREGASIKIVANGTINSVAVAKSDANVVIKGSSDSKIDVTVDKPGVKVSTAVPVAVTANRRATVVIAKGADDSIITANASVKVAVAAGATVASVEVKTDANVNLIAKGTVSDVTIAKEAEGARLNINASGTVENVTIDAKADVAVAGTTTDTVKVTVNAADTTVKAETAVDTTLNADAKVDLGNGAEGSKVTTGSSDVKAEVSNGTTDKVTVTDSTGKETTLEAGKTENTSETTTDDKKDNTNKTDNNTSGQNTSGGSPSSDNVYIPPVTPVIKSSAKEITAVTISGVTTSVDNTNHKITMTFNVNVGTTLDLQQVTAPAIAVSEKATITPSYTAGSKVDFSQPNTIKYTVTAEDGTTQEYTVEVVASYGDDVVATTTIGAKTTGYCTLDEAVNAANNATEAATIKLFKDVTDRTTPLQFQKNMITLDLNGRTISGSVGNGVITIGGKTEALKDSGDISPDYTSTAADVTILGSGTIKNDNTGARVINMYYGSKLLLDGGVTVTYLNPANHGRQTAVCVWGDERAVGKNDKDATATKLTVNKATIDKTTYGVSVYGAATVDINEGAMIKSETTADKDPNYAVGGNGTYDSKERNDGTIINVYGGTIDGGAYNAGIYQPQDGTLNISGGTISGCAGLDIKAGTVNITGGTIKADNNHYSSDASALGVKDGANAVNCALAIVEKNGYNYGYKVNVTISDGTFTGAVKVLRSSGAANNQYQLSIKGGSFNPDPSTSDYSGDSPYTASGTVSGKDFIVTKKTVSNS